MDYFKHVYRNVFKFTMSIAVQAGSILFLEILNDNDVECVWMMAGLSSLPWPESDWTLELGEASHWLLIE